MTIHEQATDLVLGAVTHRALEVVALPADEREERYTLMQPDHFQTAVAIGFAEASAWEVSANMEAWIRAMVKIIEAHGGSAGGRA